MRRPITHHVSPVAQPRRAFLADLGMGFTGLALGAMLQADGVAKAGESAGWSPPDGRPHFAPKAKNVIWLFMVGGASHLETFDPKPEVTKYAGQAIGDTPHKEVLAAKFLDENLRKKNDNDNANGHLRSLLYPLQVGFSKHGQSGIEISDWWPHLGAHVDDIGFVRSMWTTDICHAAQLQFHTGRNQLDGIEPTIGAWTHYGLGSLNDNLPKFVVLGDPINECCGGVHAHGADYLGPTHAGVRLAVGQKEPLPFSVPGADVYRQEQRNQLDLLGKLNTLAAVEYPDDPNLKARIKAYELAYRMQMSVPEVVEFDGVDGGTQALYGLDADETRPFGQLCLTARRLVERGVRFVQVFHGGNSGAGAWDGHSNLADNHGSNCRQVDRPIAGLLSDLKRRGLLDETIVVWGSEFGRTPGAQNSNGRDHHPFAFTVWLAGGGIKGGVVHGATDAIGFHAVENRHYVTDLHATVLHQLGLDPARLEIPGHKRLAIDIGRPIREIIA